MLAIRCSSTVSSSALDSTQCYRSIDFDVCIAFRFQTNGPFGSLSFFLFEEIEVC
jgi:hypothetical protein